MVNKVKDKGKKDEVGEYAAQLLGLAANLLTVLVEIFPNRSL